MNRIQWSWVQIPLRPTLYSYFKESFSGEGHNLNYLINSINKTKKTEYHICLPYYMHLYAS